MIVHIEVKRRIKAFFLLLCCMILYFHQSAQAAEDAQPAITGSCSYSNTDDTLTLSISVIHNPGFMGMGLYVSYDYDNWKPQKIMRGELLNSGMLTDNMGVDGYEGTLKILWSDTGEKKDDGKLVDIVFIPLTDNHNEGEFRAGIIPEDTFGEDMEDISMETITITSAMGNIPLEIDSSDGESEKDEKTEAGEENHGEENADIDDNTSKYKTAVETIQKSVSDEELQLAASQARKTTGSENDTEKDTDTGFYEFSGEDDKKKVLQQFENALTTEHGEVKDVLEGCTAEEKDAVLESLYRTAVDVTQEKEKKFGKKRKEGNDESLKVNGFSTYLIGLLIIAFFAVGIVIVKRKTSENDSDQMKQ